MTYDPDSRGWSDLAAAVILQAIYDVRIGRLSREFGGTHREAAEKNMQDAEAFLMSERAVALAGEYDPKDFLRRALIKIDYEIELLKSKIVLVGDEDVITGTMYEVANKFGRVFPDKVMTFFCSRTKKGKCVIKKGGSSYSTTLSIDPNKLLCYNGKGW